MKAINHSSPTYQASELIKPGNRRTLQQQKELAAFHFPFFIAAHTVNHRSQSGSYGFSKL